HPHTAPSGSRPKRLSRTVIRSSARREPRTAFVPTAHSQTPPSGSPAAAALPAPPPRPAQKSRPAHSRHRSARLPFAPGYAPRKGSATAPPRTPRKGAKATRADIRSPSSPASRSEPPSPREVLHRTSEAHSSASRGQDAAPQARRAAPAPPNSPLENRG